MAPMWRLAISTATQPRKFFAGNSDFGAEPVRLAAFSLSASVDPAVRQVQTEGKGIRNSKASFAFTGDNIGTGLPAISGSRMASICHIDNYLVISSDAVTWASRG